MIIAHIQTLRPSIISKINAVRLALCHLSIMSICALSGCVQPSAPYRLLSDEVIGMIASPPYSAEQVREAQVTLRQRSAARLRETVIQSQLKSLACMIVSQQLDPTSARGERAPSELPCSFDSKQSCAHRCKRSRLPLEIKLPKEYSEVAKRHDDMIWEELNRVAESGVSPKWESYLTQCLDCNQSQLIKRQVCLRDVDGVDLTAERKPHGALDRWLNQCSSLSDPKVVALVSYRERMITPPEDLPYPLTIPELSDERQSQISAKAMIGQGMRLLAGALDETKIEALLKSQEQNSFSSPQWLSIQEQLRRRLDAPLMPCLEQGLDTCIVAGQIGLAREQARRYLERCTLCEHRSAIETWREGISLTLEPIWQSQEQRGTQVILRHSSPSSFVMNEDQTISRFNLDDSNDRIRWRNPLVSEHSAQSEDRPKLILWPPKPKELISPSKERTPLLLASNEQALYALDYETGTLRWTYQSPFTKDGALLPCLKVDPLPSGMIRGDLSGGGAICYKKSSIHLINQQGELITKLICHDARGCGERVAMTRVRSDLEIGPPRDHGVLIMAYPQEGGEISARHQTLSIYKIDHSSEEHPLAEVAPSELNDLAGEWSSLLVIPAHQTEDQQAILLSTRSEKSKLSISAIRLSDHSLLWDQKIKGRSLLYQPSHRLDDSSHTRLIGVLTEREFKAFKLSDGVPVFNELLPLKRRAAEKELVASQSPLFWEPIRDQLLVLHPLNQALYYTKMSEGKPIALRKNMLSLENLDPSAYLTSLDAQWVVVSPSQGAVLGVHSQLDQLAWHWRITPFEQLSLSRSWALFTRGDQASLHSIKAQSLDELGKPNEGLETVTSCSKGDRWDCLYQADRLIGIKVDLSDKDRAQAIVEWYYKTRQARSFKEANLTKVDALIAQDSWAIACHWGVAEACTRLGILAEFGFYSHRAGELPTGIASLKTAASLFERATQLGDPFGAERSGVVLEQGLGVPRDYLAARRAYLTACEAGYSHACARYGFLNELGLGAKPQLVTAISAYQRACKAGSSWACDRLESDQLKKLY